MWNPDYTAINEDRVKRFLKIKNDPALIAGSKVFYKTRPIDFINDWGTVHEPRNVGTKKPSSMPFVLFDRQVDYIQCIHECFLDKENGATEKCRDVGATWGAVAFSVWGFTYHSGVVFGFGSRKSELVDRIGDPNSIFEKIRMFMQNLPSFCKPIGFEAKKHAKFMNIINPEDGGGSIIGEVGDNIGHGGRTTMFFKDESARYEHAEKIQSGLDDNTDVQFDISSVNGPDTVFQQKIDTGINWEPGKKIESGQTRVFIFDWRDHPNKNQEWYDKRRAKAEREGLLHNFKQQVDRDTTASIDGILIPPEWIESALDAHIKLGIDIEGQSYGSLDVADEGQDNHSVSIRKGVLLNFCNEWHDDDTGQATQKALFHFKQLGGVDQFIYDCIGVGAGVKAETNRLKRKDLLPPKLKVIPWNAGSKKLVKGDSRVVKGDRDSPLWKDFVANLKAQGWWKLRTRFLITHKAVTEGQEFESDEIISICSKIEDFQSIKKQLSQATYSPNDIGKIVINKQPKGKKSPNKADSIVMLFCPILPSKVHI